MVEPLLDVGEVGFLFALHSERRLEGDGDGAEPKAALEGGDLG